MKSKLIYLALKMKILKAKSYYVSDFPLYSVRCLIVSNIALTCTYLFSISTLFKDPAEVWVRTPTMTRSRLRNSEPHTPTTRPDGATALPPGSQRTASVTFDTTPRSSPQAQVDLTTPTSLNKVQTSVFRLERSLHKQGRKLDADRLPLNPTTLTTLEQI